MIERHVKALKELANNNKQGFVSLQLVEYVITIIQGRSICSVEWLLYLFLKEVLLDIEEHKCVCRVKSFVCYCVCILSSTIAFFP